MILLILEGSAAQENPFMEFGKLALALRLLIGSAALFVRQVLQRLLQTFDTFHEYIFLLVIGWCLGLAEAAAALGISQEIGAREL